MHTLIHKLLPTKWYTGGGGDLGNAAVKAKSLEVGTRLVCLISAFASDSLTRSKTTRTLAPKYMRTRSVTVAYVSQRLSDPNTVTWQVYTTGPRNTPTQLVQRSWYSQNGSSAVYLNDEATDCWHRDEEIRPWCSRVISPNNDFDRYEWAVAMVTINGSLAVASRITNENSGRVLMRILNQMRIAFDRTARNFGRYSFAIHFNEFIERTRAQNADKVLFVRWSLVTHLCVHFCIQNTVSVPPWWEVRVCVWGGGALTN